MDLQSIQARVPDYQTFMTVDELNQSSYDLAAAYPEVVKVETAGYSREGRPILHLTIGRGSKNALMFGCPHPNEPIGAMTLEFLTRLLAEDEARHAEYMRHILACTM